ncbi:MAG: hypothetical protein AMR96_01580, partial [Candidatus Adiutrix intracellularis]
AGTVLLNDHDLTQAPMHQRARLGLTYLPQEPSVFRRLSVEDNIMSYSGNFSSLCEGTPSPPEPPSIRSQPQPSS